MAVFLSIIDKMHSSIMVRATSSFELHSAFKFQGGEIIVSFEGIILLLNLHQYFNRNPTEITKGCLDTPHSLANHFSQVQSLLS